MIQSRKTGFKLYGIAPKQADLTVSNQENILDRKKPCSSSRPVYKGEIMTNSVRQELDSCLLLKNWKTNQS